MARPKCTITLKRFADAGLAQVVLIELCGFARSDGQPDVEIATDDGVGTVTWENATEKSEWNKGLWQPGDIVYAPARRTYTEREKVLAERAATRPREVADRQGKMWRLLPDLGLQTRVPGTLYQSEWREAEGWELAEACESRHVVADLLANPTGEVEAE